MTALVRLAAGWAVLMVAVLAVVDVPTGAEAQRPDPYVQLFQLVGGGNLGSGHTLDAHTKQQYSILNQLGATTGRLNLYPEQYLDAKNHPCPDSCWNHPDTSNVDASLLAAYNASNYYFSVQPIILFEFYDRFINSTGLGTSEQWFNIGKVFAERFRPNGTFAREHDIPPNFGVTYFSAFNEPDGTSFCPGHSPGPEPYLQALAGLAKGVASVDPNLFVAPGGFKNANAFSDWTLCGLGPALAPLYNQGLLKAIDLHTYMDVNYAPMEGTFTHSAQNNFLQVVQASSITVPVLFAASEFNFKYRNTTRDNAAAGFLTALFDNAGVVQQGGNLSQTLFCMPWNLFHTETEDVPYGMAESFQPYRPGLRAQVLQRAINLTMGMALFHSDPLDKGLYLFSNGENLRKTTVWQNRKGWSSIAGSSFTLDGSMIAPTAPTVYIYTWQGLHATHPIPQGAQTLTLHNLPTEQTLMFFVTFEP